MPVTMQGSRIPVICVDESSMLGAKIFDPNSWSGASKAVIQSCWTEYSVIGHCAEKIKIMCIESETLCQKHIQTIRQQWHVAKFDLQKIIIFGELPDLHLIIEAFFSGIKTLLDLLVQILASERIVNGSIDGFHRTNNIYGGKVLKALTNNASKRKKKIAAEILKLITDHKKLWIDQAILARDQMIHPEKGMQQLMFQLNFIEQDNSLLFLKADPPIINSENIDKYSERVIKNIQDFTTSFLGLLRVRIV